jgi:hypothetical protein
MNTVMMLLFVALAIAMFCLGNWWTGYACLAMAGLNWEDDEDSEA